MQHEPQTNEYGLAGLALCAIGIVLAVACLIYSAGVSALNVP